MLTHLNPTVPDHTHVENHVLFLVSHKAPLGPARRRAAFGKREERAIADHFNVLGKGQAGFKAVANIGHMHPKTAIAHDKSFARIKQGKPFLDCLNRIGKVGSRRLGFAVRLGQL